MTISESEQRRSIRQLDDSTIGHIAAGEVVERPAQVVKELVENSIDAGASRIRVEIERGGFDRLTVIDDGGGILGDELELAVKRHATSKLVDAADLAAILTLGFRGEALASIGIVSEMTVSSRPENSEGNCITVNEGEVGEVKPAGIAPGTVIEVRNIFGNLPARLSFQKRPSTETAAIVDIVVACALCNPSIGFAVEVDGRNVLETPPSAQMQDRLFDLLGAASERLVQLQSPEEDDDAPGDERWSGWISPPDLTRSRNEDIHIIINGRPVAAGPFLQPIRRGYATRLMVGRNPICVLMLNLAADEVDVNVHPTKREVRLRNTWRVLERLERSIRHTMLAVPTGPMTTPEVPLRAVEAAGQAGEKEGEQADAVADSGGEFGRPGGEGEVPHVPAWAKSRESVQTRITYAGPITEEKPSKTAAPLSTSPMAQEVLPVFSSDEVAPALSSAERDLHRYARSSESTSPLDEPEASPLDAEVTQIPAMEPLSQFADSYILAQGGDELFIIDQHALHERIRYERLRDGMSSWASQPLLQPIVLELSAARLTLLRESEDRLAAVGFTFELGESEAAISAVPEVLLGSDGLQSLLADILDEIEQGAQRFESVEKLADEIAFMKSCRGAVKANQKLSLPEMRRLLNDMTTIRNPWACVHGRPTVLRMPLNDLDGHFGRHG